MGTLLQADPARVEHACLHEFHCTGCPLLAAAPEAETAFKEADLARLIAALPDRPQVEPLRRPSGLFEYRHTAKQIFGRRGTRTILGSYVQGTHRITDNAACPVLAPPLAGLLDLTARSAHELRLAVHSEEGRRGLRHAVARVSRASGNLVLLIVSSEDPPLQARALGRKLRSRIPELSGVEIAVQTEDTNALLDANTAFIEGTPWIEEELLGFSHRIGPRSFFQVNPAAAELLFQRALALAGTGERCVEAYAGVGALTFPLSKSFSKVRAIESAKASVETLRAGIARHALPGVEVEEARVEDVLAATLRDFSPDALVLDPPRAGSPPEIWSTLGASSVQRVVLLACEPDTLPPAALALRAQGFACTQLVPVDQFPRTAHWEAVARFDRVSAPPPGSQE